MNKNGRFRNNKVYFTQVSNEILRDNTISLKAKGLYALIQSYINLKDNVSWEEILTNDKILLECCKEGEVAFKNTWKELKEYLSNKY